MSITTERAATDRRQQTQTEHSTNHQQPTLAKGSLDPAEENTEGYRASERAPFAARNTQRNNSQEQLLNRWPRAFARLIDLGWQIPLFFTIAAIVLGSNASNAFDTSSPLFYLLLFASLPCALLLDALIAGIFGNTPAKALVGVKATSSRGERLGLEKHIQRSIGVWTDGFAMGVLPLTAINMRRQFKRVSGRREAQYDERLHVRMRSGRFTGIRVVLALVVLLGFFAFTIYGVTVLQQVSQTASSTSPQVTPLKTAIAESSDQS